MNRKVYIETSVISYLTARPSKNVIEAGTSKALICFGTGALNMIFQLQNLY